MTIEQNVRKRLEDLIALGQQLRMANQHGQVLSDAHYQKCVAWFAPVQNLMQIICPNLNDSYRKTIDETAARSLKSGLVIQNRVGEATDVLVYLLTDIDNGLLSSLVDSIRAETFDDFLDHSQHYLDKKMKNEAGVIAGVVFEDTIRRICDKNQIPQKGESLENLINTLVKNDIITQLKAKRAKVSSHVRTKATHAQWDEFELEDVKATVDFTRELISNKLDS